MVFFELIQPRIFPHGSARQPSQVDRAQDLGGDLTLTQTKLYEMGRTGKLGVRKETPSLAYPFRQYEYGSMAFWYALANKEEPGTGDDHSIDLDDLKAKMVDISAYYTDDDKITFRGTAWFPKLRVGGFTIDIGDPDAAVERSFDLVGEDYKILPGTHFCYATSDEVETGGVINILLDGTTGNPPVPVKYASTPDLFIFRVIRVKVATGEVEYLTSDWSYNEGTKTLTVTNCIAGDIVKVYYPSADSEFVWEDNNDDPDALYAEDCEIWMKVGVGTGISEAKIYRLQSVGMDIAFDRVDYKEIGNKEVVQTGVTAKTVTISLDRFNEGYSLEQALVGADYPYDESKYIDPRKFADNIQILIKVYKYVDGVRIFGIGYLATALSPIALASSQAVEEYGRLTNSLEGDALKISNVESEVEFA